jgi:hypothetical protein
VLRRDKDYVVLRRDKDYVVLRTTFPKHSEHGIKIDNFLLPFGDLNPVTKYASLTNLIPTCPLRILRLPYLFSIYLTAFNYSGCVRSNVISNSRMVVI